MGKHKNSLPEKTVSRFSKLPGLHAVGGVPGLYLNVSSAGACSWIHRYSINGKRRDMGLGGYDDVTLEQAREAARDNRKLLRQGIDPLEARREQRQSALVATARSETFKKCLDGYLESHSDSWKNAKHAQQWRNTIEQYAVPHVGNLPVSAVDTTLVIKILDPIWREKTETATRIRSRLEAILDWAKVRGYRDGENPARWKGHLDKLLPKPSKVAKVEHFAALPYQEISPFMEKLRGLTGFSAPAVEFAILTAARSGEVREATWSEIDLKNKLWTIPAHRMKAKKEHRVPLSDQAVTILNKMDTMRLSDYVFPGQREGKPLSDMSLTAVLRRMGYNAYTVHGFRSTFRDWCAECTPYPNHVAEMALAHAIDDKVEAAYRRGDLFIKRTALMKDWASYCYSRPAVAQLLASDDNSISLSEAA